MLAGEGELFGNTRIKSGDDGCAVLTLQTRPATQPLHFSVISLRFPSRCDHKLGTSDGHPKPLASKFCADYSTDSDIIVSVKVCANLFGGKLIIKVLLLLYDRYFFLALFNNMKLQT